MKSISRFPSSVLIRVVSFTRSSVGLLIPWRLLVLFIWFVLFLLLTHNVYSSSQSLVPCPNVIERKENLSPNSSPSRLEPLEQLTRSTSLTPPASSIPPASLALPESAISLALLEMRDENRRKHPQEPKIFKQLPELLLRALKELARMQIAADEALTTRNTTLYSEGEGNPLRPVTAPQGPSLFQEAIGNRLKAHHLEIKTRELKDELTKQGFLLNDDQWIDLLQYQIYLIQNQEIATSEGQNSSREDEIRRQAQERDEKERAYQQQELSLLQLAVKLIHEAQNLDQKSNDHIYQNSHRLGQDFFTTWEWIDHPDRLLALIHLGEQDLLRFIAEYILPQDVWKAYPQVVTNLIERSGTDQWTLKLIIKSVLSKEFWANHSESPSWMTSLFQQAGNDEWTLQHIAYYILSKEFWANHSESPSWMTSLFQKAGNSKWILQDIAEHVLSNEYWSHHPESPSWVTTLFQLAGNNQIILQSIIEQILSKEYWANHLESPSWMSTLFQQAGNNQRTLQFIAEHVLSKEYWANHSESPSWVTALIQQAGNDERTLQHIAYYILSKKFWVNHSESPSWMTSLFQKAGNSKWILQDIAYYTLSKEYWAKYPESPSWVTALIQQAGNDEEILEYITEHVLSKKYWRNHPQLKALVRWGIIPRPVTVEKILAALARGKRLPSPLLPTHPTAIPTSQNSPVGSIDNRQADPEKSHDTNTEVL